MSAMPKGRELKRVCKTIFQLNALSRVEFVLDYDGGVWTFNFLNVFAKSHKSFTINFFLTCPGGVLGLGCDNHKNYSEFTQPANLTWETREVFFFSLSQRCGLFCVDGFFKQTLTEENLISPCISARSQKRVYGNIIN